MAIKLSAALLLSTVVAMPASGAPKKPTPAPALKLERVVMLMRHGIRPPTKAQPLPAGYTTEIWPSWPVAPGLLTPRGAAGVGLLGTSDRARFAAHGLIGAGCPQPGDVVLKASGKPRAIDTAKAWGAAFLPGCAIVVDHPTENGPDPIFHGLDDQPVGFDGAQALRDAQAHLPKGGLAAETRAYGAELTTLARVLNCARPACPLFTQADALVATPHDRPELEGPLDIGSTASQSLLLEYLEGMPMKDVGWGRVSRDEISQMLRFHPLKFRYSNRPDYVARAAGTPLADEVLAGLQGKARITLLAGHDTNLADLGGFLRVHWAVPSYPADDVPPGGALGFELLRDAKGVRYVRAFFRAQMMDQLRGQVALTGRNAVTPQYLALPGCGNSAVATACTLSDFARMVAGRRLTVK